MTQPLRVYADFNGLYRVAVGPSVWRVPLDTFGTLIHLAALGVVLHEGTELTVFDQSDEYEDLEGDATAVYDHESQCWIAEIDRKGCRYVPTRSTLTPTALQCVNCAASIDDVVKVAGRPDTAFCPSCGTPANTQTLPPSGANDA